MPNQMYFRYLKRLYEKASAAWRREQRKRPKPCEYPGCGDTNAEVMPEGNWLCREHKAGWKACSLTSLTLQGLQKWASLSYQKRITRQELRLQKRRNEKSLS